MSFDAELIIVGGGLAGLSAGITAARLGINAILLERGEYSGSKNVSGGRIYVHSLVKLIPEALEEAPLEREIEKETFEFYCGEKKVTFSFEEKGKKNSFSVLRAKLDNWLAKKAEETGLIISYSTLVLGAKREGEGITLETNRGQLTAPLVIDASGVTSVVFRSLGLRKFSPEKWMLGVKEVVKGKPTQGEARVIVGAVKGIKGGGFVYANRDTFSVGVTATYDSLPRAEVPAYDLVEKFRERVGIEGEVLEYSAHAIPYYGYGNLPSLTGRNLMAVGDSAGFLINDGFTIRGMDLAIASGMIAGIASKKIIDSGNFNDTSIYEALLRESFIMKHLELAYNRFKLINSPHFLSSYPEILCQLLSDMFSVGEERRSLLEDAILRLRERGITIGRAIEDAWRFVR